MSSYTIGDLVTSTKSLAGQSVGDTYRVLEVRRMGGTGIDPGLGSPAYLIKSTSNGRQFELYASELAPASEGQS